MPLNQVQVDFVQEAVRPTIEEIILFRSKLDAFVLDYDNQQSPLPTTAAILDDNGASPRTDAPTLTGANVQSLRTFCANMRDQITPTSLNTLVALSAQPLEHILRRR
jgi:hypothetical protein